MVLIKSAFDARGSTMVNCDYPNPFGAKITATSRGTPATSLSGMQKNYRALVAVVASS